MAGFTHCIGESDTVIQEVSLMTQLPGVPVIDKRHSCKIAASMAVFRDGLLQSHWTNLPASRVNFWIPHPLALAKCFHTFLWLLFALQIWICCKLRLTSSHELIFLKNRSQHCTLTASLLHHLWHQALKASKDLKCCSTAVQFKNLKNDKHWTSTHDRLEEKIKTVPYAMVMSECTMM